MIALPTYVAISIVSHVVRFIDYLLVFVVVTYTLMLEPKAHNQNPKTQTRPNPKP